MLNHDDHDVAHDEDGSLIPVCGPDYDTIDRDVFHVAPQDEGDSFSAEEYDAACTVITRLIEWLWQDGMKNCDGLQNRAVILCWVFLSQLRPLTMTEMARGFGKKKQSLGRAVDDFKTVFPKIRIAHMKD
jgi:hypothetical protein